MLNHGSQLVRLVANAQVVSDRDPSPAADFPQPILIGAVVPEVVGMPFDRQTSGPESLWKLLAQIPIREEDRRHATRS